MVSPKMWHVAEEFTLAHAFYEQAMMHRRLARARHGAPFIHDRWSRAHACLDSARFHLAQCGALLGLNAWPK